MSLLDQLFLLSFLDHHTSHPACHDARILLYECVLDALYWKSSSYRSSLDLTSFGKAKPGRLLSWFARFSFWPMCMLFDLSVVLWLHLGLLRLLRLHLAQGLVRHGYPWVPTDLAHGHPREVGLAYQKTRWPDSGPNQPSWWRTRPPEDLSEDSLSELIQNNYKTWQTEK
jgi:hypothetical protein